MLRLELVLLILLKFLHIFVAVLVEHLAKLELLQLPIDVLELVVDIPEHRVGLLLLFYDSINNTHFVLVKYLLQ